MGGRHADDIVKGELPVDPELTPDLTDEEE